MSRRFLRLAGLGAALTANGLRPLPGSNPLAVPSFFASWLTSELAPHNLAITVGGSAAYVARRRGRLDRDDKLALALNAASVAGLAWLIRQGLESRHHVERALTEGLHDDYVARLDPKPDEADLTTPWRQVLMPWQVKHPAVKRVRDIDYVGDGNPRHRLDVYHPRDGHKTGLPVIVQVHGGGWVIGRKEDQGLPLMTHLAARDWVCMAPNYPLSPKATWPDHLVALKRALVWVREHAEEFGGDPSFIAVTGGSAGGHLAAMLALTQNDPRYQPGFEDADTSVQACVPFYGAYDLANVLDTRAGRSRADYYLNKMVFKSTDPAVARDATPLLHVHDDAPPFFVIHGAHDSLVPVAEARELVRRLREVSSAPVLYAELPGGQHAFDVFASIRSAHVIRGVERFLRYVYADHADMRSLTA
ncbi:MAG TPA: alpha/beta hydrolase [Mycobacteriales bacterium]|nr:alpha/beta hydrolase [Mycobacteriales bacterium]